MPIACRVSRERPSQRLAGETRPHMRVPGDIQPVIVIDKAVKQGTAIQGKGDDSQKKAAEQTSFPWRLRLRRLHRLCLLNPRRSLLGTISTLGSYGHVI